MPWAVDALGEEVVTVTSADQPDGGALAAVAAAARVLADRGPDGLGAATGLLAAALSVPAQVVVRAPGAAGAGPVLAASAGRPVPWMRPADSASLLIVSLTAAGRHLGSVSVVGESAFCAADTALVHTWADVAAATLSVGSRLDAAREVLDAEAERAEIAAALHEGPTSTLIAARHALDEGAEAAAVRAIVVQALRELRELTVPLRTVAAPADLARALAGLADTARAAGCRVELAVSGLPTGRLPLTCSVAAYRVVAAALHGAAGPATVVVERGGDDAEGPLVVCVTGARDPLDTGALDRWARRVEALGGRLERFPDGVSLELPLHPAVPASQGAVR